MSGNIEKGFSEDAVYVAWGAPSEKKMSSTAHGSQECWTYIHTYNGTGGGYFGISRGLVHDKQGDRYDADDYYPAPETSQTLGGTPSTDVPIKRVVFERGRVVSFETANSSKDKNDDGSPTSESVFRSAKKTTWSIRDSLNCVIR